MHRFCNPVFHIVGSNPMPCTILLKFMPVLNSIGRVAAQSTHDEHASKVSPEGWISLFLGFAILGGYVLGMRTLALPFLYIMIS